MISTHERVLGLPEIAFLLISFLQPDHLLACVQVCRAWKSVFEGELWANVVYLRPSDHQPLEQIYAEHLGHPCNLEFLHQAPRMRPPTRFVDWWCRPAGHGSRDVEEGSIICQSCNLVMAQELDLRDLHLTTAATGSGARDDAGSDTRTRIVPGGIGGGKWKIYRTMTANQWRHQGPLIRSLAGISCWDRELLDVVAKYCGDDNGNGERGGRGGGGGILRHLELEIPEQSFVERMRTGLMDLIQILPLPHSNGNQSKGNASSYILLEQFFSSFASPGCLLSSISVQLSHRSVKLHWLRSLRHIQSLRTLEIRGLVNWYLYSLLNQDPDEVQVEGGGSERGVGGPRVIRCPVADLLHIVVRGCPDLETLRLTRLLLSGGGLTEKDEPNEQKKKKRGLLPECELASILSEYQHPKLRRLILPMPLRTANEADQGRLRAYLTFFQAFPCVQDLDLTLVNWDFRGMTATETMVKILQSTGQHLRSLTLRFQPENVGRGHEYSHNLPHSPLHLMYGSLDFGILSRHFPKSLVSLSLRDIRIQDANFFQIDLEAIQRIRRFRLLYRRLSTDQANNADMKCRQERNVAARHRRLLDVTRDDMENSSKNKRKEEQEEAPFCCFMRDLFEYVMNEFSSLVWCEIAQTKHLPWDLDVSHPDLSHFQTMPMIHSSKKFHSTQPVAPPPPSGSKIIMNSSSNSSRSHALRQILRPWACQSTLEYLDINRFPLFHRDRVHTDYVDHVLLHRLSARVMPQLKVLKVDVCVFRLPFMAISRVVVAASAPGPGSTPISVNDGDSNGDADGIEHGLDVGLKPGRKRQEHDQDQQGTPVLDLRQLRSLFVQGLRLQCKGNRVDRSGSDSFWGPIKNHVVWAEPLSEVELEILKGQVLRKGARLEYCHFGRLRVL
ncbi:hypothetical protein BGZ83_000218 [Gryganskiella cystojenkinii]|nr:hypothetical protein BGZ83_000218 [Gryganskiella cystojenkinii]